MSSISFDLNELLYARPDNEITARAIMNDFLDANVLDALNLATATQYANHTRAKITLAALKPLSQELQPGFLKSKAETRQNLRAFRTKLAFTKDSVQISVPNLSNPKEGSSTFGRTDKLFRSLNKLRIDKKDTKGMRIAKSALKAGNPNSLSDLDDDRRRGNGGDWQRDRGYEHGRSKNGLSRPSKGFGNGPSKDPGFGNEPLKDLRKGRTTGNYIGNPLPIRLLARQSTLTYGTSSAFNDDRNDFLKLRAADLHPRAKELALFARSFPKELKKENLRTSLSECFKKLVKKLKGIQGSLRPGLKDDRSFANKLYSACKNVLKTTIARMNLAFTSTAAVADIRKAIAFATKTSRPLAKASKKAAKATKGEKSTEGETVYCHFTEEQLRTIHKRFGHFLAVHDLGTNFNSATFRGYFKGISSTLRQMLMEAYHSVELVERYHVFMRRAFKIVTKELLKALREDRLQIAIKAINDTAGPNGLILTLFERAAAINKAIREVRKCYATKQVKDALKRRNSPITEHTLDLLIGSRKYDLSIPTVLDEKESDSYVLFTKDSEVLITDKERRDYKLLAKLRAEGIIKSLGALFQESRAKELARLMA
ncbi:polyprotein [Drepanopeziza brunnea f. sp. 'multigermtubi' MB_m1]|uniref:Polyprotein n=1 Tax=Marssonina brunnea f. sp. multigermtubi (strain MB_m1) TaxID=1072389 RepID=K1WMZ9_MARBU|nr:polyprotein [Drepanopeziza brunnea f. sp. 'multigermtubi' MB_m1]EKD14236.1 polyprotein [Drepanopeziza brunnea f. sp. 'multigermtubi' MB_m1]